MGELQRQFFHDRTIPMAMLQTDHCFSQATEVTPKGVVKS